MHRFGFPLTIHFNGEFEDITGEHKIYGDMRSRYEINIPSHWLRNSVGYMVPKKEKGDKIEPSGIVLLFYTSKVDGNDYMSVYDQYPIGESLNYCLNAFRKRHERIDKINACKARKYTQAEIDSGTFLNLIDVLCSDIRYCSVNVLDIVHKSYYSHMELFNLFAPVARHKESPHESSSIRGVLQHYIERPRSNEIFVKCESQIQICFATLYEFFYRGYVIKKCPHCNRVFVPNHLSEKYCDGVSPVYPQKTCKEAMKLINKLGTERSDELIMLHKQIYNVLRNRAHNRIREKADLAENQLNSFVNDSAQWREDIDKRLRTPDAYKEWLLAQKTSLNIKEKGAKKWQA